MKRAVVLGSLLGVALLTSTLAAVQQRQGAAGAKPVPFGQEKPSADALMVEKVKPNLYVLRGGGGNTAAFITEAGVVLVDTKLPGWGQPLIQKLKTITPKPVTTIINTHAHFDHASGNVEFPPKIEIVTHVNTKTYMEQSNPVSGVQQGPQPNIYKQNGGRGMPTKTYRDSLTLGTIPTDRHVIQRPRWRGSASRDGPTGSPPRTDRHGDDHAGSRHERGRLRRRGARSSRGRPARQPQRRT